MIAKMLLIPFIIIAGAGCKTMDEQSSLETSGENKSWKMKCKQADDQDGEEGVFKLTPKFSSIGGDSNHDATFKYKKTGQIIAIVNLDCKLNENGIEFKCKPDSRYGGSTHIDAQKDDGKLKIYFNDSMNNADDSKLTKVKAIASDCEIKKVTNTDKNIDDAD